MQLAGVNVGVYDFRVLTACTPMKREMMNKRRGPSQAVRVVASQSVQQHDAAAVGARPA